MKISETFSNHSMTDSGTIPDETDEAEELERDLGIIETTSNPIEKPPLSHWTLNLLSFFWFANQLEWTALLVILIPYQIAQLSTNETKGQNLSLVLFSGSLLSCLTFPIFGAISDGSNFRRWGKRKPFVIIGAFGSIIGLIGLGLAGDKNLPMLFSFFMVARFFGDLAAAPYSGMLPDTVSPAQYGAASGWIGVHSLVGSLVGGLVGLSLFLGIFYNYLFICLAVVIGSLLSVIFLPEGDLDMSKMDSINLPTFASFHDDDDLHTEDLQVEKKPESVGTPFSSALQLILSFGSPFKSSNFLWVFITRFIIVLGTSMFQQFLQYYIRDVIPAPYTFLFGLFTLESSAAATSIFITAVLVGAVPTTLIAGILSDRNTSKTESTKSSDTATDIELNDTQDVSQTRSTVQPQIEEVEDPLLLKKRLVCLSGLLHGLAGVLLMVFPMSGGLIPIGLVFGLGYGAFSSVDWALGTAVLPDKSSAARDMGVWHLASTLPSMASAAIAGPVVDAFQGLGQDSGNRNAGYYIIYCLGVVLFCLGGALVFMVRPNPPLPVDFQLPRDSPKVKEMTEFDLDKCSE